MYLLAVGQESGQMNCCCALYPGQTKNWQREIQDQKSGYTNNRMIKGWLLSFAKKLVLGPLSTCSFPVLALRKLVAVPPNVHRIYI